MNGRGRSMDNVFIERLWRSTKYEAVYLHELSDGIVAERPVDMMNKAGASPIPTGSTTTAGRDKQDFSGMIRRRNTP